MNAREIGESPANPVIKNENWQEVISTGITTRQAYKIAATPVPEWFEPRGLVDKPEEPKRAVVKSGDPPYSEIDGRMYQERRSKWIDAVSEWQAEKQRQILLQWPGYWADMMLAEDSEHTGRAE